MIGREAEKKILQAASSSEKAELIAVFGRRRIGKTYLIRSFFQGNIDFEMVGLKEGDSEQQLRNFSYSLRDAGREDALENIPADWLAAFYQLKNHLSSKEKERKRKIVFIDEVPWVAGRSRDFLTGLSYFWNSYAAKENIVVVICGSATAWMIQKILNDRGGLHNRVSRRIHLQPFTLSETEAYFMDKGIHFNRYQILQLYMALGGVPHYIDQVEGGKTAVQNIDAICFHPQGMLRTEFDNLYTSLFNKPERYEAVVLALATKWKGLSRQEIIRLIAFKDGGGLTSILRELELSGFIASYVPFGKKKKDTLYRLIDHYSLFYLKFIKDLARNEAGRWDVLSRAPQWKSWSGYAFENICLQHVDKIKQALGIAGIQTRQYSYLAQGDEEEPGLQLDLLIDRDDNAITLCEMKFYNTELRLDKTQADKLRQRSRIFQQRTQTKKQLFWALVSTYGLQHSQHSLGLIDAVITMDDLF